MPVPILSIFCSTTHGPLANKYYTVVILVYIPVSLTAFCSITEFIEFEEIVN